MGTNSGILLICRPSASHPSITKVAAARTASPAKYRRNVKPKMLEPSKYSYIWSGHANFFNGRPRCSSLPIDQPAGRIYNYCFIMTVSLTVGLYSEVGKLKWLTGCVGRSCGTHSCVSPATTSSWVWRARTSCSVSSTPSTTSRISSCRRYRTYSVRPTLHFSLEYYNSGKKTFDSIRFGNPINLPLVHWYSNSKLGVIFIVRIASLFLSMF